MVTVAAFRARALAIEGTIEAPHFELTSFRLNGKIFATLAEKQARAMVKLRPEQQEMLTAAEPLVFERIPNAWGDKGATWLHLKHADCAAVESALLAASTNVAAPRSRKAAARKPK